MNKQTYFNNQYTLCQYTDKAPELHYQDFTLQLTPEGTIHLSFFFLRSLIQLMVFLKPSITGKTAIMNMQTL